MTGQEAKGEITPIQEENMRAMVAATQHPQYAEYFGDPELGNDRKAAVSALVLYVGRTGLALSDAGVDRTIEMLDRHELSVVETTALLGDIADLSEDELETKVRRTHIALEFFRDVAPVSEAQKGDPELMASYRSEFVLSVVEAIGHIEAVREEVEGSGVPVTSEFLQEVSDALKGKDGELVDGLGKLRAITHEDIAFARLSEFQRAKAES